MKRIFRYGLSILGLKKRERRRFSGMGWIRTASKRSLARINTRYLQWMIAASQWLPRQFRESPCQASSLISGSRHISWLASRSWIRAQLYRFNRQSDRPTVVRPTASRKQGGSGHGNSVITICRCQRVECQRYGAVGDRKQYREPRDSRI